MIVGLNLGSVTSSMPQFPPVTMGVAIVPNSLGCLEK